MRKFWARAAIAGLVLTAAVACSSGSNNSGGTTSGEGATAGGTSSSSSSAAVSAAQAFVKKYTADPTSIGITTPLSTAPAKGKTFVSLECNAGTCPYLNSQLKLATQALGWKFVSIPFDISNPANLVSAMTSALQYKPVAVSFAGLPEAVWSSEIPAYKAAEVAIIPVAVGPLTTDSTVIANVDDASTELLSGQLVGNWFVTQTAAKPGNVLVVSYPDVPVLSSTASGITQTVASGCPSCKITQLKATTAEVQAGGVSAAIVSALQSDPSIKYVLNAEMNFTDNLPSQLAAAGLSGVVVAGAHPDITTMSGLARKQYAVTAPTPLGPMAWMVLDAASRFSEHLPIPSGVRLPMQLVTPENVGTVTSTSAYLEKPGNFAQQFMTLWKVGS